MGLPTKVQLIKRKSSEQWYINFPSAIAQAMDFSRGETVEWSIEDKRGCKTDCVIVGSPTDLESS